MTQEEIIEGNRLIAEFMGASWEVKQQMWSFHDLENLPGKHYSKWWTSLLYHESWDWLKPVIDKIFTYSIAYKEEVSEVREMKIVVDIIPAWKKCVQFIQWYNNTQNKPE